MRLLVANHKDLMPLRVHGCSKQEVSDLVSNVTPCILRALEALEVWHGVNTAVALRSCGLESPNLPEAQPNGRIEEADPDPQVRQQH